MVSVCFAEGPPPSPVVAAIAVQKQIAPLSWVAGVVISRNDARLSAEYSDRLVWVAEVGDQVKQRDVVARLKDTTASLDLARYRAEVNRESARKDYLEKEVRRLKTLSSSKNVSQSLLEESISDLEVSRNQLASNKAMQELAEGQLRRTQILAPFDGVVSERLLTPGEWADSGDVVLRLVDTKNLEVKAQVPTRLRNMMRLGDTVQISGNGQQHPGSVRAIVPVGDAQSHLFELRVTVSGEHWSSGDAVRVAVPEALPRDALVIPRDALVLRRDGIRVFKINPDDSVVPVEVTTGIAAGPEIEVIGDLQPGDRVVAQGGERMRPGQTVRVIRTEGAE